MDEEKGSYIHLKGASSEHPNTVSLQGIKLKDGEFAVITTDDAKELQAITGLFREAASRMQKLVDRFQARLEEGLK